VIAIKGGICLAIATAIVRFQCANGYIPSWLNMVEHGSKLYP